MRRGLLLSTIALTAITGAALAQTQAPGESRPAPAAQQPAPSAPAAAPAQASRPQIETKKVDGTDNVYIFRNGNHQAMFVVTKDGVIATDPVAYGRPTGG